MNIVSRNVQLQEPNWHAHDLCSSYTTIMHCWFLRVIDSSSPHSWVSLSNRMQCCRCAKAVDSMWENVAMIWDGRTKSFSPLACSSQKGHGSWLHVLDRANDLSRLQFVLCIFAVYTKLLSGLLYLSNVYLMITIFRSFCVDKIKGIVHVGSRDTSHVMQVIKMWAKPFGIQMENSTWWSWCTTNCVLFSNMRVLLYIYITNHD